MLSDTDIQSEPKLGTRFSVKELCRRFDPFRRDKELPLPHTPTSSSFEDLQTENMFLVALLAFFTLSVFSMHWWNYPKFYAALPQHFTASMVLIGRHAGGTFDVLMIALRFRDPPPPPVSMFRVLVKYVSSLFFREEPASAALSTWARLMQFVGQVSNMG